MNCENIHKKHTGSHLQNILNQKSWSEVKVKWMLLSEHTSIKMIKTATYEDLQRDTQTKAIHPNQSNPPTPYISNTTAVALWDEAPAALEN